MKFGPLGLNPKTIQGGCIDDSAEAAMNRGGGIAAPTRTAPLLQFTRAERLDAD